MIRYASITHSGLSQSQWLPALALFYTWSFQCALRFTYLPDNVLYPIAPSLLDLDGLRAAMHSFCIWKHLLPLDPRDEVEFYQAHRKSC